MKIAKPHRLALAAATFGLLTAFALPGSASAANLTCRGHAKPGTVTEDAENPLQYTFACTGRVLGYTVVSDRELDFFDAEVGVKDPASGALVPTDSFGCEGDFPGFGFNCVGVYGTNRIIEGTTSLSGQKPCAEPRPHLRVVVVAETVDPVTNVPKKSSIGTMAGPFDLGRPRGCPKSSELAGLLALVEQLRAALRAPSSGDAPADDTTEETDPATPTPPPAVTPPK